MHHLFGSLMLAASIITTSSQYRWYTPPRDNTRFSMDLNNRSRSVVSSKYMHIRSATIYKTTIASYVIDKCSCCSSHLIPSISLACPYRCDASPFQNVWHSTASKSPGRLPRYSDNSLTCQADRATHAPTAHPVDPQYRFYAAPADKTRRFGAASLRLTQTAMVLRSYHQVSRDRQQKGQSERKSERASRDE
jgi:hypothetical protein